MDLRAFRDAALHLLLPEICAHCKEDLGLGARGPLCGACLGLLVPDLTAGPAATCAFLYRGPAVSLIHAFKFRGSRSSAVLAGDLMARMLPLLPDLADYEGLVPVPLHPRRLLERGYNQALILALAVSRRTGLPVIDLLERVKATEASWGLSRAGRRENLKEAFRARRKFSGGGFLIVDDVLTTGATLAGCGRALLDGGARRVRGFLFARQPLI